MKKVAALDLGTNSFICLVASLDENSNLIVHEELVEQVRLGEGLNATGVISVEALKRAENCLQNFSEICKNHQVTKIKALATSAARDAKNGQELMDLAKKYQIDISIIEGDLEARYSFAGALQGLKLQDTPTLVVDIGGGSTEFIYSRDQKKIDSLISLNCGAVRLTEKFFHHQPPSVDELKAAEEKLETDLKSLANLSMEPHLQAIAIAGTPTSLVAAELGVFDPEQIHGALLSEYTLSQWKIELEKRTPEEINQRFGFGKRSDIILAGVMIMQKVLHILSIKQMMVSTKGVRYGLAREMLEKK